MQKVIEDEIRARAHQIWEQEGRPDGRAHDHWERAKAEIMSGANLEGAPLMEGNGGEPTLRPEPRPHERERPEMRGETSVATADALGRQRGGSRRS